MSPSERQPAPAEVPATHEALVAEVAALRTQVTEMQAQINTTPLAEASFGDFVKAKWEKLSTRGKTVVAAIGSAAVMAAGSGLAYAASGESDSVATGTTTVETTGTTTTPVTTAETDTTATSTTETTQTQTTETTPTTTTTSTTESATGGFKAPANMAPEGSAAAEPARGNTSSTVEETPAAPAGATTIPEQRTGATQADDQEDAPENSRKQMLKRASDSSTVAWSVKRMHSTKSNFKANLRAIEDMPHRKVNNEERAMNRIDALYKPEQIGAMNAGEALVFGVGSSSGNAKASYNAAHGRSASAELPEGTSVKEARKYLFDKFADKSTKFKIEKPTGSFMNHGQRSEDVFEAGVVNLDGSDRVLTVTSDDGTKLYYKVFNNGCINILTPYEAPAPTPVSTPEITTFTSSTPTGGGNEIVTTVVKRGPGDTTTKKTTKKKQGGTTQGPGTKTKVSEKTDDGRLPGSGIPADQDKGTPDVAGTAPATAGESPAHVPRQPQDTTPAPAPVAQRPEGPKPPAEETPDPGTTGPATPAQGSTTPAPQLPNAKPAA